MALADHDNETEALPAVACRPVGALGAGIFGVALILELATESPPAFVAFTV